MEIFGLFIPILAVIICGAILLGVLAWGLFILLVQIGVIVRESRKPPHLDGGTYELHQGRDIGRNDQPPP